MNHSKWLQVIAVGAILLVAGCASPDQGGPSSSTEVETNPVSFDAGMTRLTDALDQLGYEDLGGDHETDDSSSFLVGRDGLEEFQISTGWDLTEPQGEFEALPGPIGDFLMALRRGERAGVYFLCGDFYVEVLALDGDPEAGAALAGDIHTKICE